MKLTQKINLVLGAIAVADVSFAQSTTANYGSATGLLGQRYGEVSFGVQDVRHISPNAYGLGAAVNTPLVPSSVDVGATYNYGWIGGAFRSHANTLGAYANAYAPLAGVKPFVGAGVGWQWTSARFVGSDDTGLWALNAGVEIPAGSVTITPRISYADDFENSRDSSQEWSYQVEANCWVNSKTAVFASIGKTDVRHSAFDSWNYTIGARFKF